MSDPAEAGLSGTALVVSGKQSGVQFRRVTASKFPQRFGSYVLVNHLGRGGMGTVFLAIRGLQGLETVCVIKRLVPEFLNRQSYIDRFFDEARLARRLVQANLVQTFDVGKVGEELFLAQEYVHGVDVSQLMGGCWEQHQPLPVPLAAHIVREVARGLAYAHDFEGLGIVHRDISPPNIRLSFAGEVKLLDFGVAKSAERSGHTQPQEAMGKQFYMAPEQLFDEPVDRRADVYTLGLVLWELLTLRHAGTKLVDGKVVAGSESRGQMLERLRRSEYQPPSLFNPEVQPGLDQVALRCLERDPGSRFQSAGDLVDALAPFLPSTDPNKLLKDFLGRLFNVEAEGALIKRLVDEGRPVLPVSEDVAAVPAAADPPPSAPEPGPEAPRRRTLVYGIGAVTLAIVVFAIFEITKTISSRSPAVGASAAPAPAPTPSAPPPAATRQPPAPEERAPVSPTPQAGVLSTSGRDPAPRRLPARKPEVPKKSVDSNAAELVEQANEAFINGDLSVARRLVDRAIAAGAGPSAKALRQTIDERLKETDRSARP